MRAHRIPAAAVAALLVAPAGAAAQPHQAPPPEGPRPYVEQLENAYIDWGEGIAAAWGRFLPSGTGARERLETRRRVAELDAKARLLRIVERVRATSEIRVGDRPDFVERVRGIVRGAVIVEEGERPGGVYEVLVTVPLHGVEGLSYAIHQVNRPTAGGATDRGTVAAPAGPGPDTPGDEAPTSLLIDARGTGLLPALLPRILGEDGRVIASPETVDQAALRERGMAAYATQQNGASQRRPPVDDARPRVAVAALGEPAHGAVPARFAGSRPPGEEPAPAADPNASRFARRRGPRSYRLKASAASGSLKADVVLSKEDADRLEASPATSRLLRECRVLIIVESPVGGVEGIRGRPPSTPHGPGRLVADATRWPKRD